MIYEFIWGEFCDWYIELSKSRLYDKEDVRGRNTALYVLGYVLEHTLRLLHPFMPFITEEIWQKLPHEGKSIMVASWPKADEKLIDDASEKAMTAIMETIKAARNMRAEVGAKPGVKAPLIVNITDKSLEQTFMENVHYLAVLAAAEPVTILDDGADKPENARTAVAEGVEVYLPLKGLIDVEAETNRMEKEKGKLTKEIERLTKKLSNKNFVEKAPAAVVEKEREKLAGYQEKMKSVESRIRELAEIG